MKKDHNTNGNYRSFVLTEGDGCLLDAEEIHRIEFGDKAKVKCFLVPPIDKELPEQEVVQDDFFGFKLTGIYSDKDLKVVTAEGGKEFPKHSHPGKEWIQVITGSITVYCYRVLAIGFIVMALNGAMSYYG